MIFAARPAFGFGQPPKPVVTFGLGIAVRVVEDIGETGLPVTIPGPGEVADFVAKPKIPSVINRDLGRILSPTAQRVSRVRPEKIGRVSASRIPSIQIPPMRHSALDRVESRLPTRECRSNLTRRPKDCS